MFHIAFIRHCTYHCIYNKKILPLHFSIIMLWIQESLVSLSFCRYVQFVPGGAVEFLVSTPEMGRLLRLDLEWRSTASLLNPLTWRLFNVPQIYIKDVIVTHLESGERWVIANSLDCWFRCQVREWRLVSQISLFFIFRLFFCNFISFCYLFLLWFPSHILVSFDLYHIFLKFSFVLCICFFQVGTSIIHISDHFLGL